MKVLIFGATGMIGQGVLRECLLDPDVSRVVTIGRSATRQQHSKLEEIVHRDLHDFTAIEPQLSGFDACFFCLGIASAGMTEEEYQRITHDIAVVAAETLLRVNPAMTFIFVSGMGADSTERGRTMWARVKGKAENAILRIAFKGAYVFRPGFIQPLHGIRSRTTLYRVLYMLLAPALPLMRRLMPGSVTTTEVIGRAMLNIARKGADVRVLHTKDINRYGSA